MTIRIGGNGFGRIGRSVVRAAATPPGPVMVLPEESRDDWMVERAAIAETHCAVVVFVGDRAYKLKKPVDLGFLDFRTVGGPAAGVRAGGRAQPPAGARRVPRGRRRDRARRRALRPPRGDAPDAGEPTSVHPGQVRGGRPGRRCGRWPGSWPPSTPRPGTTRRLPPRAPATRSGNAGRPASSRPGRSGAASSTTAETAEVERLALRYLAGAGAAVLRPGRRRAGPGRARRPARRRRVPAAGRAHGRWTASSSTTGCATSTASTTRPSSRWTWSGSARPELGRSFLDWYVEFSGAPRVPSLEHHYVAYRAFVRAKVACLRAAQGDAACAAGCARVRPARSFVTCEPARVRLVLVGGLPGVGKSTVAGGLADRMQADRVPDRT